MNVWEAVKGHLNEWYYAHADAYASRSGLFRTLTRENLFQETHPIKLNTINFYLSILKKSGYIQYHHRDYVKVLKEIETDLSIEQCREPIPYNWREAFIMLLDNNTHDTTRYKYPKMMVKPKDKKDFISPDEMTIK